MDKSNVETLRQKAHEALDKFLKPYRESDSGGGWAPFTAEDETNFWEFMWALIGAKFEPDSDGDYPLNFKLTNRTYQEPMSFVNLPYSHKCNTLAQKLEYIRTAQINLSIANDFLKYGIDSLREDNYAKSK
ncbi:MAG: hypothetical protein JWP44_4935 [Mucilaginibacter sp.]|nr:hypothetical protein [Mucilaginibacter sp.]